MFGGGFSSLNARLGLDTRYMLMVSILFFLLTGSVGLLSSFAFAWIPRSRHEQLLDSVSKGARDTPLAPR